MKTAVSIPTQVFRQADVLARRLGVSRSNLYSQAISQFVQAHQKQSIREALDAVYGDDAGHSDPVLRRMQARSLPKESW